MRAASQQLIQQFILHEDELWMCWWGLLELFFWLVMSGACSAATSQKSRRKEQPNNPLSLLANEIGHHNRSFHSPRSNAAEGFLLLALLLLGRSAASFHSMKESKLASQKKAINPHATALLFFLSGPNPIRKKREERAKNIENIN